MCKQRKITELVGRVVELKEDGKRYLVMPFELRGKAFDNIIGTIEGRLSSKDLVYKDRVIIMPLIGMPDERRQVGDDFLEGKDFIVRNIREEDIEKVQLLNKSMSEVLNNIKKLYRNLTELKELEKRQSEIELKINKLKNINSEPLGRWSRPANKSYLLELCKNEIEVLDARKRLEDEDRPLYRTSLMGSSNASKIDVLELLKATDKPTYHRYGLAYRGAKAELITREKAIDIWVNGGPNGGFLDMDEEVDCIIINEYSSNDMF